MNGFEGLEEKYKNGRPWELNFPYALFEAILSQTKNDYVQAKVKLLELEMGKDLESEYMMIRRRVDKLARRKVILKSYWEWLLVREYEDSEMDEIAKHIEWTKDRLLKTQREYDKLYRIQSNFITIWGCLAYIKMIAPKLYSQIVDSWDRKASAVASERGKGGAIRKHTSNETIELMRKLKEEGVTLAKIAERTGVSEQTVCKYTKSTGRRASPQMIDEIIRLRKAGYSIDAITKLTGTSTATVQKYIKGIKNERKTDGDSDKAERTEKS